MTSSFHFDENEDLPLRIESDEVDLIPAKTDVAIADTVPERAKIVCRRLFPIFSESKVGCRYRPRTEKQFQKFHERMVAWESLW